MAHATALTATGSRPLRFLLALGLGLCLAAPAMAGEQILIWRDAGGAVRFSSVPEATQPIACVREQPYTPAANAPEQPLVLADALLK